MARDTLVTWCFLTLAVSGIVVAKAARDALFLTRFSVSQMAAADVLVLAAISGLFWAETKLRRQKRRTLALIPLFFAAGDLGVAVLQLPIGCLNLLFAVLSMGALACAAVAKRQYRERLRAALGRSRPSQPCAGAVPDCADDRKELLHTDRARRLRWLRQALTTDQLRSPDRSAVKQALDAEIVALAVIVDAGPGSGGRAIWEVARADSIECIAHLLSLQERDVYPVGLVTALLGGGPVERARAIDYLELVLPSRLRALLVQLLDRTEVVPAPVPATSCELFGSRESIVGEVLAVNATCRKGAAS